MLEFIKKNVKDFIIIVLFIVLILDRFGCTHNSNNQQITKTDTVHSIQIITVRDSTITHPVFLTQILPTKNTIIPTKYVADTADISDLRAKYRILLQDHETKNITKDSIKVDTFGIVSIEDTTFENNIVGRRWNWNIKVPIITNTITKTIFPKSVTQLYFGGGIYGVQGSIISGFDAGLLLKNKKDQIFKAAATINTDGLFGGQIETYWKIRL